MALVEKVQLCKVDELEPYQGRAAWVDGEQVALFLIPNHGVFAIQNWDPIGKAYVLCRGIVGDINGELCVASPLYKQHFKLSSGECIEQPETRLRTWPITLENNSVVLSSE